MTDDKLPEGASVVPMGIYREDDLEFRFVLEPWGWRLDLMIDLDGGEVRGAPETVVIPADVLETLDAKWKDLALSTARSELGNST